MKIPKVCLEHMVVFQSVGVLFQIDQMSEDGNCCCLVVYN